MFHKPKPRSTLPDKAAAPSTKDWLPVKSIANGIIALKSGDHLKILEVLPINFKLRSKSEKRNIITNYREFLKACHFPMQVSIVILKPPTRRLLLFYPKRRNTMPKEKLHFTDQQIQQADSVNLVEYARQAGYTVQQVTPHSYKIPGHGGLYIHADGHNLGGGGKKAGIMGRCYKIQR